MSRRPRDATVDVAVLTDDAWNRVLGRFRDASVYQTRAYAATRGREDRIEHCVLRRGGVPVAAAQVELVDAPLRRARVARVFWGPVWRPAGAAADPKDLDVALEALREEYAMRRQMVVRVVPRETSASDIGAQLLAAGWSARSRPYRTVLLEVARPADDVRRGLHQNWRRNLAKGQKAGLEVTAGTDDESFEVFMALYREMRVRKSFESTLDPVAFRLVLAELPYAWKPRIFTARKDGVPVAAIICSLQGDTGIYLFGASADAALPLRASYVAHWCAIEWLIEAGAARYDLGGASPANPGTYQFKTGTGGDIVEFVGEFEHSDSRTSRVVVHSAELARTGALRLRRILRGAVR